MGFWNRNSAEILREEKANLTRSEPPAPGIIPPPRMLDPEKISVAETETLSILTRALQMHQAAIRQCPIYGIDTYSDERVSRNDLPAVVRKPMPQYTFGEYLARATATLFRHGNRYSVKNKNAAGQIESLTPLNASDVTIEYDEADATKITQYYSNIKDFAPEQISHMKFILVDDIPLGITPLIASAIELKGIYNVRNYARRFIAKNSLPLEGYLKTALEIDDEHALAIKTRWKDMLGGEEGIAVLDQDLTFTPLFLKPSDLQWVDVQKFDAIQQARMAGITASMGMISLEGSSQTYKNLEQDRIDYTTFGLMNFILPIQDELTEIAQSYEPGLEIRFNLSGLLRADTLTRYQAHQIALGGTGTAFLEVDEIRSIEDRDPIGGKK